MKIDLKSPKFRAKNLIIIGFAAGILIWSLAIFLELETKRVEANSSFGLASIIPKSKNLATIQGNSLLPVSNITEPIKPTQKIKVVVTAYSSSTWETDDTPYITASGKTVKEGIVANNLLSFGTQIKIPEIYGDKVFVVEDRMSWKKGNYHFDIWFPDYWQAKDFGAKTTYIEILES